MKITDIRQGAVPSQATGGVAPPTGEFQRLLEARLAEAAAPAAPGASPTTAVGQEVPAALRLEGLELTETALDILERFQAALADGRFAAADLEPFAAALEDQTAALLAIRDQLPADHPLAGVLDRVATVTYLESAKFRRGDYQ